MSSSQRACGCTAEHYKKENCQNFGGGTYGKLFNKLLGFNVFLQIHGCAIISINKVSSSDTGDIITAAM